MTTTSSVPSQRSLHLLDLENLVGDPRADEQLVRDTLARYLRVARWRPGDHVIIASNPGLMHHVVFAPPVPWNAHATCGPDGADLMLLSLAPPELVARCYDRLVIGSGDHIFAARAHTARDLGVEILVVARAGGCSSRLRVFPHVLLFAPEPTPDPDPDPPLVLAA